MNRAFLVVLSGLGALLLRVPADAQPQAPATAPAQAPVEEPKGPPPQEVVSAGTLPDDLVGRWLVVGWINMKDNEHAKTTTALWEVTREDAQLVFRESYEPLPERVQTALTDANSGDNAWRPTPQDVADVGAAWGTKEKRDPQLATLRNELYGRDGFDRDFKNETQTKDAIWAARQTGNFRRSAQPTVRSINVFGAMEQKDGGYAGNYTAATIAAAPFPIPIKLEGKFQMYRVAGGTAAPKPKGFLESLFSGCGK